MQHEVTVVQKLLDQQGYVVTPGWARRPVWQYNRENIAAPSFRIKEWDYYLAGNEHYAVAFTLSDLGYAGLISVSLIDLVERKEHTDGNAYGSDGSGEDIGRWQCGFQKWSDSSSLYGEAA